MYKCVRATSELLLALLDKQPRHGYEIKHEYDA